MSISLVAVWSMGISLLGDWNITLAAVLVCRSPRVIRPRNHYEEHDYYECSVIGGVEREDLRSKRHTEFGSRRSESYDADTLKTESVHLWISVGRVAGQVYCRAERPRESKIHDVIRMTRSTLCLDNPRSSQNNWRLDWRQSLLWCWATQEVLRDYGQNLLCGTV